MNALLFERPIWFATGPLTIEEEAQEMEDFTYHRPVLVAEVIELLAPRAGSARCRCDLRRRRPHAKRFCAPAPMFSRSIRIRMRSNTQPSGLSTFGGRVTLRQCNFRDADEVLDQLGIARIGGALLDLGVSSRQLENAERGFSIMRNGPLDMRMDPRRELTAATIVNHYSEEELTRLFRDLGEEPAARRIASQIGETAQDDAVPRYVAAGAARSRKLSGATDAVIRRRRFFKRCGWK